MAVAHVIHEPRSPSADANAAVHLSSDSEGQWTQMPHLRCLWATPRHSAASKWPAGARGRLGGLKALNPHSRKRYHKRARTNWGHCVKQSTVSWPSRSEAGDALKVTGDRRCAEYLPFP